MQEQTEGQATIEHYTWMGEHWYRKSEVDARMDALRAVADAARRYFTALDDPEGDTRTTRDELRAAIAKAEPHA